MWKFVEALGVKRNDLEKGIYYSMSGEHVPTYINDSTNIGLSLEENNSDISIKYNFDKDLRDSKGLSVPKSSRKIIFLYINGMDQTQALKLLEKILLKIISL